MTTVSKKKRNSRGFDVTVSKTIGRVELDGNGQDLVDSYDGHKIRSINPQDAALLLISEYLSNEETGGEFRFIGPDENTTFKVTVEYELSELKQAANDLGIDLPIN